MARTALIKTTNASTQDCAAFSSVSKIAITASTPAGTSMRFVVRTDSGEWKHYNTSKAQWEAVATQELTPESVMAEGNTKEELEALAGDKLSSWQVKLSAGL